jgi:small-conductance mechanosensitive channel
MAGSRLVRRFACIALALAAAAAVPARAEETAMVPIGDARVLVLRATLDGRTPAERAASARRALEDTLADPDCDPEGFAATEPEPGLVRIAVCGRTVLDVGEADATAEGVEARALAERWVGLLREAWTAEKTRLFSRKLLQGAILGVVYPLLFLAVTFVLRLLVKRTQRWVERIGGARGLRVGPVLLTAEEGERGLLSRLLGFAGWAGHLFLAYVFLIAFFDRFPRTARWAQEMLTLLGQFGATAGITLLGLLPRLLAAVLLLLVTRVVLRFIGAMFKQVRLRKLRVDPILTPETAGPAEITARALVLGLFLLFAGLLVPGEAGTALLAGLALAGFALALGSRPLAENFLAGLVALYGRPFRTGQALRIGDTEGIVERKGFLHLRLRQRDERIVLVPNRRTFLEDVRVADAVPALRAEIVLRPTREDCAPEGLFRHAASEAGLKRDEGHVELRAVRDGALVYRVEWPYAPHPRTAEIKTAFFGSLLARGKGLGVEILSVREAAELP